MCQGERWSRVNIFSVKPSIHSARTFLRSIKQHHSFLSNDRSINISTVLLIYSLQDLSNKLTESSQSKSLSATQSSVKNLKLLFEEGNSRHHEFKRKSFSLLNNNLIIDKIQSIINEKDGIYSTSHILHQ